MANLLISASLAMTDSGMNFRPSGPGSIKGMDCGSGSDSRDMEDG